MKIAYDAKRIFNNITGLGNYSRALLRNVHQYFPENEYVLLTPTINESIKTDFFQKQFKIIQPRFLPKSIWRSYGMAKDVEKEKIDIFHGLSNEIPKGLGSVKSVVTIHDLIFKVLPETYPFVDRTIYDKKTKYCCEKADVIIAISESTKRDILKYYRVNEEKIKVIYQSCHPIYYQENHLDKTILKTKLNLPKEFILSVGSLETRKNTLNIIKALAATPQGKRTPLYILGKGKKYKKILQAYIHEKQIQKWIFFIEAFVTLPELKALYELASLVVYPSMYEGFGLPVVESLLCKTPVITSNISSLPEAAGTFSTLIDPNDTEAIKFAMLNILNDTQLQDKMAKNGYEYAYTNFHPKKVTHDLMDVYKALV